MENNNRGALFKNHRKEQKRQPDYKGEINVEGRDYWISAWLNESKNGQTYMGLEIDLKDQQKDAQPVNKVEFNNSDVPF